MKSNLIKNLIYIIFTDEPCRTYAIYASDSGDEFSGLEYDNTCVGYGGMIISISDGNNIH